MVNYNKFLFEETLSRTYFLKLVNAIEYLHKKGLAHTNLKLENIYFNNEYDLKILDF